MTAEAKLNYETYELIIQRKDDLIKEQKKVIGLLEDQLECSENFTEIHKAKAATSEQSARDAKQGLRIIIGAFLIIFTILSAHYYRMRESYMEMREKLYSNTQYENGNRKLESGTHR